MASVGKTRNTNLVSGQSGREILRLEDDAAVAAYMAAAGVGGAVAWDDVTGKPTEFPPEDHEHAWGEIQSTPTTLAGYGITDAIQNGIGDYGGVTLSNELTGYNFLHQSIDATGHYDETQETDVFLPTASIFCNNYGDGSGGVSLIHGSGVIRVRATGDSGNGVSTVITIEADSYGIANPSVFRAALGLGSMATAATTSYLALSGGTVTGRVNFSGASALLVLGSVTTAERTAQAIKTNGDILYESTVNRYCGRVSGTDRQFLDTSGGQILNGGLTIQQVSGNLTFSMLNTGGGTNFSVSTAGSMTLGSDFSIGSVAQMKTTGFFARSSSVHFVAGNASQFRSVNSADGASGSVELAIHRSDSNTWQISNGTSGTYRNLILQNLTATGLNILGTYTVGTLPSAAANTRARAFASDSNLAFNSTNLGSTVTAGGSTLVPVFSNGTNWVIG